MIKNLDHLRDLLIEHFKEDHKRLHYKKKISIADLIEEEKKYGLALPEVDYPVFKESTVTANKYGEVTIDRTKIHIPTSYHYSHLHLITYWDSYKIISPHGEILSEGQRPYMNKEREIPWQEILKNWVRKPRSIVYSRYFPYLPGRISHYLNIESLPLRKNRAKWLVSQLLHRSMSEIDEHFYELLPDDDNNYNNQEHPYDVNWSMYDSLQPSSHLATKGENTNA